MAKIKGTVVVDKERCKGCGVCVASCPCNVLGMSAEVILPVVKSMLVSSELEQTTMPTN